MRIVKLSIRIGGRYCRFYAGLGLGFATANSFGTAPVYVSVKKK